MGICAACCCTRAASAPPGPLCVLCLFRLSSAQFVLLNSLIHDPDFHALVPRFALPEGAAPPPDPDELDDADLAPPPSSLGGASTLHLATHLVVCNLDSKLGRRLAAEVRTCCIGDRRTLRPLVALVS